jgi:hypothetical protein
VGAPGQQERPPAHDIHRCLVVLLGHCKAVQVVCIVLRRVVVVLCDSTKGNEQQQFGCATDHSYLASESSPAAQPYSVVEL